MHVGINNIIYMELHLGPKMANGTCRKTIVARMIDRRSTVALFVGLNWVGFSTPVCMRVEK
jgi:hypothetical protein